MRRIAPFVCVCSLAFPCLATAQTITFESLLREMVDREAVAKFPEPAYTCKQFSSYDRASTTAENPATWFANGDVNQYIRVEETAGRKEWVMADMDGPGAIVRIWSANPKGTLRVYLDTGAAPVIERKMEDVLGGKWRVEPPLSEETSRGWNLYLPIPYAKHCKITSDADGFYYQVNHRTYAPRTGVKTLAAADLAKSNQAIDTANGALRQGDWTAPLKLGAPKMAATGESVEIYSSAGPNALTRVAVTVGSADMAQALRSVVLVGEFDGEQTIWAPLDGVFAQTGGVSPFSDRYRRVMAPSYFECAWVMPFKTKGTLKLVNLGKEPVGLSGAALASPWKWDARSMHFHTAWRQQYPLHVYGGKGTLDWNYVEVTGKGVYVGDTLAVMNPVPEWWGEGDEKIYVDGEKFPSHFGTGTEDYYGYAWCCPVPFTHPFHSQVRCDGHGSSGSDTNWGHTTVTRVRSLDAIPFTKKFKFDIEAWHWKECDVAYAAVTCFYATPGATSNREPQPAEVAKPLPQPPPPPAPMKIEGALECEQIAIASKTEGLLVGPQEGGGFGPALWSGEKQLWVQARKPGDFVELSIPRTLPEKRLHMIVYATRSWDYGIVQFSINGKRAGKEVDLFNDKGHAVAATGPIDLGEFEAAGGRITLRAELVGSNPKAEGTKSYFGLDCVVVKPVK